MKKYALLTGATGLVGRYLVRDLLLAGHRLAVVVRSSEQERPAERIEAILQMWEDHLRSPLPRPVVLEGDVTESSFGLSPRALAWVQDHCDRVLHNAAVLTFYNSDRNGEPWRTNLQAAQNAIDLCAQLGIEEFHHVSTAYVSGTRVDLVREDELDVGQRFRNDYEESKFLAEKLVRSASFLRSLTIYRPAVIAGDSQTGYTSTYHGLYHYLKLMSVLNRNVDPDENGVRHTPLQLQMTGDEPRNIVPVDWVSAVMCRIFGTPSAHGLTYHLSPRECVTPRKIVEAGYKYFNSCGVEFLGPELRGPTPISVLDQAAQENMRMYEPYENSDPLFDTTNLQHAVPELPCPLVDNEMMMRFLQFGEEDRWGKRRAPRPNVPFWVEQFLDEELSRRHPSADDKRRGRSTERVGLNVYGPGGGQWCLEFNGERLTSVTPGLPGEQLAVSLSSADFSRLVQKNECLTAEDLQSCSEWGRSEWQVSDSRAPTTYSGRLFQARIQHRASRWLRVDRWASHNAVEQLVAITLWLLVALLAGQAIFVAGFVAALWRYRRDLLTDEQCPKAAVVLCLRGSDPYLASCLSAVIAQDYPRFLVKVVVDHYADPAWRVVEQAQRTHPGCPLMVEPRTKRLETCSLKCSSLVQAIESLDASFEFAAQLDADTVPHPTWLRELATALAGENVGAATGNRWYTPEDLAWGAWVRSVWNAAAVVQMYWYRIAWGGTLAVKTRAIREADLLDKWSHAFCEDTMLFSRLRQFGWRVEFVPSLMMVNRETCDLSNFFSWVRRQLLTARLYHPGWSAVLLHGLATIGALLATGLLAGVAVWRGEHGSAVWLAGGAVLYQAGVMILLAPMDWVVRRILVARGEPASWWTPAKLARQIVSVLLAQIVYPLALVSAAFVRRVSWRQANYQIDGPWKIRLLGETPYTCQTEDADSRASL